MWCPSCEHEKTKVLSTTTGNVRQRMRTCFNCGHSFLTVELPLPKKTGKTKHIFKEMMADKTKYNFDEIMALLKKKTEQANKRIL